MKVDISNDHELLADLRRAIGVHPDFGAILNAHANRQPIVDHWHPIGEYVRTPAPRPITAPQRTRVTQVRRHLDHIEHDGTQYVTVNVAKTYAIGTPLESIVPFQTGNVYSHTSHRLKRVRRLEIGPPGIAPTVLYSEEDCRALVAARLNGRKGDSLPIRDPNVTRITHLTVDGERWIKLSEALAIIQDVPIEMISRLWHARITQSDFDVSLLKTFSNQVTQRTIASITVGNTTSTYVRHADVIAYATVNAARRKRNQK